MKMEAEKRAAAAEETARQERVAREAAEAAAAAAARDSETFLSLTEGFKFKGKRIW